MHSAQRSNAWYAWGLFIILGAVAGQGSTDAQPQMREFQEPPGIRVVGASSCFRFNPADGVEVWIDARTLGALALADWFAVVPPTIAAARLPVPPIGSVGDAGTLNAEWSATDRRLSLRLGSLPLTTVHLSEGRIPKRVLVRHLDRLALLALPPSNGPAVWVWVGSLRYLLLVPDAEQYLLCSLDEARYGRQPLDKSELFQGIPLGYLDQTGDVIVRGRSPSGEPFHHCHRVRSAELDERVQGALASLSRSFRSNAGAGQIDPGEL